MKKPGDQFSAPFVPVASTPSTSGCSPEPSTPLPPTKVPEGEAPPVDRPEIIGDHDDSINIVADEEDNSNNSASESQPDSDFDNRYSVRGQKRDVYGRFKQTEETSGAPVRSDSQKKRDKVFSQVTKWKKKIEETIEKIQSARYWRWEF